MGESGAKVEPSAILRFWLVVRTVSPRGQHGHDFPEVDRHDCHCNPYKSSRVTDPGLPSDASA